MTTIIVTTLYHRSRTRFETEYTRKVFSRFNFLTMLELYCCFSMFLFLLERGSLAHEVSIEQHAHFSFPALVDAVNDDFLVVTKLFRKLHYENCSTSRGQKGNCRRCVSLVDYENSTGFKASALLNSTQFFHIAPILVYFLLPEQNSGLFGAVCKTPPLPEKLFDALVANYGGKGAQGITQGALDKILERINQTSGKYLHRSECFSAHGIFEEIKGNSSTKEGHDSNESEHSDSLDEDEFQKACASILFHLVEGYCIKDDHAYKTTKLPPKTFFVSKLFGNKQRMTEEGLEKLAKKLGIGEAAAHTDKEDSHAGHNHRRSIPVLADYNVGMGVAHNNRRRAVDHHGHEGHKEEAEDDYSTCFSLDNMLTIFGVDHKVGVDQKQFKELCPAFIQQFQSGVCSPAAKTTTAPTVTKDMAMIWGYGFAAVTIISLLSLVGVATIPFIGKKLYKKVLALLVALAVGSLAGDGILHLIPHAFGLHAHEHTASGAGNHNPSSENEFLWKALVVLVAVYAFYLFETLMHLCLKHRVHEHNGHSHIDIEHPRPSSHHMSFKNKRARCSKLEHHEGLSPAEEDKEHSPTCGVVSSVKPISTPTIDLSVCIYQDSAIADQDSAIADTAQTQHTGSNENISCNDNAHSMLADEHDHTIQGGISTVAWMIIIGDTMHNISDGLAIGAAFSEGGSSGISGGISTSIAVFCHELPHELGDFAVLLSAGMSVKMALLANFLSACSCYIGLAIGIAIGQMTDVRLWIFAIAGGMFIYVALVDMLPDLMHNETLQTEPLVTFFLQNLGLITGIVIMLMIALYEEKLMAVNF